MQLIDNPGQVAKKAFSVHLWAIALLISLFETLVPWLIEALPWLATVLPNAEWIKVIPWPTLQTGLMIGGLVARFVYQSSLRK